MVNKILIRLTPSQHLSENKEWAKKNMSIGDCQNLGLRKNKSDLIPLPSLALEQLNYIKIKNFHLKNVYLL